MHPPFMAAFVYFFQVASTEGFHCNQHIDVKQIASEHNTQMDVVEEQEDTGVQ